MKGGLLYPWCGLFQFLSLVFFRMMLLEQGLGGGKGCAYRLWWWTGFGWENLTSHLELSHWASHLHRGSGKWSSSSHTLGRMQIHLLRWLLLTWGELQQRQNLLLEKLMLFTVPLHFCQKVEVTLEKHATPARASLQVTFRGRRLVQLLVKLMLVVLWQPGLFSLTGFLSPANRALILGHYLVDEPWKCMMTQWSSQRSKKIVSHLPRSKSLQVTPKSWRSWRSLLRATEWSRSELMRSMRDTPLAFSAF